jgi:arylsulfatase A-like enzyme
VVFLDLAAEWEGAEAYWLPDYRLDLGDSSFAALLDSRWGKSDPRQGFLTSQGPAAGIRIPAAPAEATLDLELEPLWPAGATSRRARVSLNGIPLLEFDAVGVTRQQAAIPASRFVEGVNLLDLDCPGASAFRLRSFRIAPRAPVGDPRGSFVERPGAASSRVWQRPGAHLSYCLQVPASATLAFGLLGAGSPGGARRQVAVETEGAPPAVVFEEGPGSAGEQRVSLKRFEGRPACLSFRVGSGRTSAATAWTDPRILAPRPGTDGPASGRLPRRVRSPNILLYIVDTLRADHLGVYGSPRDTSPNMDRLARESIVFDRAHSHSVWTKPAVGSLLTGLHPDVHQARNDVSHLAPGVKQISTYLRARGYSCLGFQVNGNVGRIYGFEGDYDFFIGSPDIWEGRDKAALSTVSSAVVNDLVARHLAELKEPFFLLIQTGDPHSPYEPRGEFRLFVKGNPLDGTTSDQALDPWTSARLRGDEAEFQRYKDYVSGLYDGEVRHNDAQFERLLDLLRGRGLYDKTAIFVTADHGEALMDHTTVSTHEEFYEETVRVPLILRPPGGTRGRRVSTPVQHMDVLPTILDLAGVPKPQELTGSSLFEIADGRGPAGPRSLKLARYRDDQIPRFAADGRGVIRWPWKLVQLDAWEPRYQLFDLEKDPGERQNLWEADAVPPIAFRALVGSLRPVRPAKAPGSQLSPAELEELRSLGYAH